MAYAPISVFPGELLVREREIVNTFEKSDYCRYECPAEEQIYQSSKNFTEIKAMKTQPPEQEGQNRRRNTRLAPTG